MAIEHELIRTLARKYHTPFYLFEEAVIRARCRELKAAIEYPRRTIRYTCKALTLGAILRIVRDEGLAVDAVSINEVRRVMLADFAAAEILYTGEGSSSLVYGELLRLGVLINCSSLEQLKLIGQIAPGSRCSIRFNPGEGHGANNKVNTGGPSSKHGIYCDQIADVKGILQEFRLRLAGIHSHIGSGTDLDHWLRIKYLTFDIARQFENLEFINLGGGLPIVYNPEADKPMPLREWGAKLSSSFEEFSREYGKEVELQIEPGRFITAECGHLVAEVQAVKETPQYSFVIVNTGLNHNPRPAMYGSFHPIHFTSGDGRSLTGRREYVVAGYLCESGDVFTVSEGGVLAPRFFPELACGDFMIMGNAGAYCHSMKSEYNSMNMPVSLLIDGSGEVRVIERRGTLDDIMRREVEAFNSD